MQSTDIVVKRKRKYIDWQTLEAEFIAQDQYPLVATWLREVKGWQERQIRSGNTFKHVEKWGSKRVATRQQILQKRIQATQEAIQLVQPDIMQAKLDMILYYIEELKNPKLALRDRSHIFNKLKTELGEPIVITKNKNEDLILFDSVERLLEAYGVKEDGKLVIDDSLKPNTLIEG